MTKKGTKEKEDIVGKMTDLSMEISKACEDSKLSHGLVLACLESVKLMLHDEAMQRLSATHMKLLVPTSDE